MFWGIVIGFFIGLVVVNLAIAFIDATKMILWQGERYKLIGGYPNRCPHQLSLHQMINGIEMRGCIHCNNAYIKFSDTLKVGYENER